MMKPETALRITQKLSQLLSDTFVLYVKTLNFHWNMTGKAFYMYHRLLQEQYEELAEACDELAERIRMLGKHSPGSMKRFLELTQLTESTEHLKEEHMIQELVKDHEAIVEHCHQIVTITDQLLDQGTSDLLVERIRSHAKQAWLLRSHLE